MTFRLSTILAAALLAISIMANAQATAPQNNRQGITHPGSSASPEAKATAVPVAATETVQASIDNFAFSPKQLTVKMGTTVVWTNKDDVPHTVTSDKNLFSSSLLDTDEKFQYTFTKPGLFTYFCKLHPMMTAVIVVQ